MNGSSGDARGFMPPHGGYQDLLSYKKALVVYDCTVRFCARFLDKRDRMTKARLRSRGGGTT